MKITDEMVERGARAIAARELGMGDAAGVVTSVVNARWKEFSQTSSAAITAALSQCEQEPSQREAFNAGYDWATSVSSPTDVRAQTIRECARKVQDYRTHIWRLVNGKEPAVDENLRLMGVALDEAVERILSLLKEPS